LCAKVDLREGGHAMSSGKKPAEGTTALSPDGGLHLPAARRTVSGSRIGRRKFLQMGVEATTGALLLPVLSGSARAGTLVDPYAGSIPFVFPLAYGTYKAPVQDN
jgi:hypothetical protein